MKIFNTENLSLPFDGKIFAKKKSDETNFYANTYKTWCFNEKPTHLINVSYWDNGIKYEQIFAILDEKIHDEEEANYLAKESVNRKEYGRVFMYKSSGLNSIWGVVSHFPRFDSEKNGFRNIHHIISYEKIESSDLICFS